MNCPNYDPVFQETLRNLLQTEPTPSLRRQIYYTVCIFLRFAIAGYIFSLGIANSPSKTPMYILSALGLISMYILTTGLKRDSHPEWWSKKFQLVNAVLVSGLALYSLFSNHFLYKEIGMVLFVSVVGGVLQSMFHTSC